MPAFQPGISTEKTHLTWKKQCLLDKCASQKEKPKFRQVPKRTLWPFFFARISPLLTAAGHLFPLFLGNEVGIYCCDAVLAPSTAVQWCFNIKPFPFTDSIAKAFQKKIRQLQGLLPPVSTFKTIYLQSNCIYIKKKQPPPGVPSTHQVGKMVLILSYHSIFQWL